MKKLTFEIKINAPASKVWQVLWYDATYRKWTSAFTEGSYAVSDWKEGSKIQFLSPDGGGMYSKIDVSKPNELMSFEHIGVIKNFEEQPLDEETKAWSGCKENYYLTETNDSTHLKVEVEVDENSIAYMSKAFPQSLDIVKELSEQPVVITVETTVEAPIEKIWDHWTNPEHITKWNNASDDWHTPRATNDLKVGGKFTARMESRDGSNGFDFEGTYTSVEPDKKIEYHMTDGRKVKIDFAKEDDKYKVIESFEAENEFPLEMQRGGWQSILDNFKKYTESNS